MGTIWEPAHIEGQGPKYKGVVETIRTGIASGALSIGEKLPPVRDLAWRLRITPGTVARAYTILTDEGVLTAEVGRGTFVADTSARTAPYVPIEIDSIDHESGGDTDNVSLFSPHLPSMGQAGLIRRKLAEIAQSPPSGVMHYPNRASGLPARHAVASWLAGTPVGRLTEADIVLSHGGQSAILLILQAILQGRRPTVLVEQLAYPGFSRAAELLRADVVSVPMDEEGLIPEALEATARRLPEVQVICTSPEVHNPTCGFTPESRRHEIAEIARRHDLQIVEDDCYRMGRAQAACYRQIAPERGWYVGSISKTITPALRIGYAVAPEGQVARVRRAAEHSFFGLATPLTDLTTAVLTDPSLPVITEKVRMVINSYVQTAVNVLGAYDLRWREDVPFLWLHLPPGWRATAFCQAAEARGVQIRAAEEFAGRDAQTPHAVRFAINAGVSLRSFEAAMNRLRDLLDNPPEHIGV